jgi:hypothetical protein
MDFPSRAAARSNERAGRPVNATFWTRGGPGGVLQRRRKFKNAGFPMSLLRKLVTALAGLLALAAATLAQAD